MNKHGQYSQGITPLRFTKISNYVAQQRERAHTQYEPKDQSNNHLTPHVNRTLCDESSKFTPDPYMNKSFCTKDGDYYKSQCQYYVQQIHSYKQRLASYNNANEKIQKTLSALANEYSQCKDDLERQKVYNMQLINELKLSEVNAEKTNPLCSDKYAISVDMMNEIYTMRRHYNCENAKLPDKTDLHIKDYENDIILMYSHIGNIRDAIKNANTDYDDATNAIRSIGNDLHQITIPMVLIQSMYELFATSLKTLYEYPRTLKLYKDAVAQYKFMITELTTQLQALKKEHNQYISKSNAHIANIRNVLNTDDELKAINELLTEKEQLINQSHSSESKHAHYSKELDHARNKCYILLQKQDAHNNEVKELQLKLQEAYSIIDEQKQYIAQLESSHKQKNNELEISIEEYKESEKVLQQQCDKYQGTAEKEKKQRAIIQNELEKANACIEESQKILKKQQEQLEHRDTQIHKLKQDLEATLMKNQKYEDMLTSAKEKKEEQYSKIYNELLLFKSKEQEWLQDRHKLLTQIDSYKKSSEKLQHFKKEFQLYLQEKKNERDRDSLSSLPTLSEGQTYQELLTEKELYIQQLEAKIKNIRSNAPNNKYSTIDNSCAEMYLKI